MGGKATVQDFQGQQGLGDLLPEGERGVLEAVVDEKQGLPGELLGKVSGNVWDGLPEDVKPAIGIEFEARVRVRIKGGGEDEVADGVRHFVKLKVVAWRPVPFEDEVFPPSLDTED